MAKSSLFFLIALGAFLTSCICFSCSLPLGMLAYLARPRAAAPPVVVRQLQITNVLVTQLKVITVEATLTPEPTPTLAPAPSHTPTATAALALPPPLPPTSAIPPTPTATPVCRCSGDSYQCSNFNSQEDAQTCFEYCRSLGRGDVHGLDGDEDSLACETNPTATP